MKKLILINLLLIFHLNLFSQKGNSKLVSEYEDTLKVIAYDIMHGDSEKKRVTANNIFIKNLTEVLQYEKSFSYPFDSLPTIAIIRSPDKTFRIFNWLLRKDNNTYDYYAFIHHYNKKRKKYELINLIDNSANIRNPEQADLDANNWYGSLIYDIAYIKKPGMSYYTLLSYDLNDQYSRKKIIDVMYFAGKNKIKFGLPIFKKLDGNTQNRVILEYDSKTSISLKYHKKEKRIIFNHLVASSKDLEGLYEYYIPEGTFNSYNYKNGKWWLEHDVDIRNDEKIKKYKRPKKGLIPR